MNDWRTEKALYEVTENSRKGTERYPMRATGNEISEWCRMKNEAYGYIEGVGGDKSYSCFAVLMKY